MEEDPLTATYGPLAAISAAYGLERMDRFEIAATSVNWLVLVVNGTLFGISFRRREEEG